MLGVSTFLYVSLADAKITVEAGESMSGSSSGSCFGVTKGRVGQAVKCKERDCGTDTIFVGKVPESWLLLVVSLSKANPKLYTMTPGNLPDVIPSVS